MKNEILTRIAADELGIENLDTQNSDRLDFHELAVWNIREALSAAYEAGRTMGSVKPVNFAGVKAALANR